jgi:hypothetical protein
MINKQINKAGCLVVICFLLVSQFGCGLAKRLKTPIEDFKSATTVVSSSTRVAYENINKFSIDNALRDAQCTSKPPNAACRPSTINIRKYNQGRTISKNGMKARLDALDTLDKYVGLLNELVNSDKPEKITAAADDLQASIDKLAEQITKLSKPSDEGDGESNGDENSAGSDAGKQKFIDAVGVFSKAIGIVLSAVGNRKRDKALKKAILNGDDAVKNIIQGLLTDLNIFWSQQKEDALIVRQNAFIAFNSEISPRTGNQGHIEDTDALQKLRSDVMEAVKNYDTVVSTNPGDALDKMAEAHDKLMKLTNEPTEANFIASAEAIQAYLAAATRLGNAVVKLHRVKSEEEEKN